MCLFSKEQAPRIAQEGIECFKVLKKENGQWITPYRDFPIEFNKEMETDVSYSISRNVYGYYEISKGYFHTCSTETEAQSAIIGVEISYKREKKKCPELRVFKAIIPKDSLFYIGVNGDYCSDKLIILKE